jgi:uncharacterized protein YneF (UPF0154 family)
LQKKKFVSLLILNAILCLGIGLSIGFLVKQRKQNPEIMLSTDELENPQGEYISE